MKFPGFIQIALILFMLTIFCRCEHDLTPYFFIASPADGENIGQGDTVTILIDVSEPDKIDKIDIYIDTLLKETMCCGHYYYKWATVMQFTSMGGEDIWTDLGEHKITAVAYSNNQQTSQEITVNIVPRPHLTTYPPWIISSHQVTLSGYTTISKDQPFKRGFFWSETNFNPSELDNVYLDTLNLNLINVTLDGLKPATTYYYKVFTEFNGKLYTSNTLSFETKPLVPVEITNQTYTDPRDSNIYDVVTIGTQTWMAENLAYLPEVNHPEQIEFSQLRYYVYDYYGIYSDSAKATEKYQTYGVLYNWPAAFDACPAGWHLPTNKEWIQLFDYIVETTNDIKRSDGTYPSIGKYLKKASVWGKQYPGTNRFRFSALPAGICYINFYGLNSYTNWWTSDWNNSSPWYQGISSSSNFVANFSRSTDDGLSVRCIKD